MKMDEKDLVQRGCPGLVGHRRSLEEVEKLLRYYINCIGNFIQLNQIKNKETKIRKKEENYFQITW